jgi:hypothetical protein
MAALKVFRTAIGFHDAYVAAPSRKAALAAWGTGKDLFARGAAEVVTDPALTAEPLAAPGQVFRRTRGTAAEQVAALGPMPEPARRKPAGAEPSARAAPPARQPRPPRPERASLDLAEEALHRLAERQAQERTELAAEERELSARKQALKVRQARDLSAAKRRAAREKDDYAEALAEWREG